ncbi:hypothetical protein QE152_g27208 [Popillia japonica]|uniref:Uncharacterized protein n=1 Tax=Popillia japonica TaxID=7064 RepID=A0AAW1JX03_POPJA
MIGNLEAYVPGDNFVEYLERLKQFLVLNSVEETKKSGACHTVLSKDKYLKFFKNKQLSKTSTRLVSVTGNSINVLGAIRSY